MWRHQIELILGGKPKESGLFSEFREVKNPSARKTPSKDIQRAFMIYLKDGRWRNSLEISTRTGVDRSHVLKILKRLMAEGIVEGTRGENPQREWFFRVPKK